MGAKAAHNKRIGRAGSGFKARIEYEKEVDVFWKQVNVFWKKLHTALDGVRSEHNVAKDLLSSFGIKSKRQLLREPQCNREYKLDEVYAQLQATLQQYLSADSETDDHRVDALSFAVSELASASITQVGENAASSSSTGPVKESRKRAFHVFF